MRLLWLGGSLALALLIAVPTLQSPRPVPADAPATAFSAQRAMVDVHEIAQRPHPVGSADHIRVQTVLLDRMAALGLQTSTQTGPLSPEAVQRIERNGGSAAGLELVNLIGVLPGRDPRLPAVALMAHYDTVPDSAGAADDTAGVAAILETVRAIRARGSADRTLVVLLTDGEELNLDGARVFWGGHPLRDRIGAVVNLEARGGGGRAMMFETGRGNAQTIDLFARTAVKATGGVSSNSLAVFVYELMPNGTDFTIPKDRGVQGINLAFIGRPAQYHAEASTPDALDQGSVQHIGAQALEASDALLRARALPAATQNVVYSDLFGRVIVGHAPATGWLLLGLAFLALGAAMWRARSHAGLTFADVGRGMVDGLWFLSTGLVLTQAVRLLAGPMSARAESADAYYTLLARLPWMEAGTALTVLALGLALMGGRTRPDRRVAAGGIAAAAVLAVVLGGMNLIVIGAAVIAIGLSLFPALSARSVWGGWSGLIGLILIVASAAQTAAPEAAFLFVWTGLLAALVAAVAAFLDPGLTRPKALAPVAVAAVLGSGWIAGLAHTTFLGIGMDLPGVLVLLGLLILMFVRPLSPERAAARPLLMGAMAILLLGAALSGAARVAEPRPAATVAAA
ncbi:M20/M25/M40 family metallo-hydrolase [Brevundimonas sp. Root1423]|uniref:M20/M25/M40 family metallo-hydrolase n=1 Tax=Brevundimonas sp. Root1423 TaxID=1736462 RepID=UPI0006F8CE0B|nr:M20/M25/M40 family metallo-hydrolase [Brevundimonas sp. Root1423]KQY84808.1 peptidase M20 [Brevundimonas sp. Root1423]